MAAARIIAVAGKGGVGKTSVSAAMVRLLTRANPQKRILAIDADPAIGLSTALGIEPGRTLDDVRGLVSVEIAADPDGAENTLASVRRVLLASIQHCGGFDFFAIGRPEAAGCYCAVNAYLRQVIGLLISGYDCVVVDGEAGIEQVNRRVLERVTHLILVTDASRKGTQVISTIRRVADELTMAEYYGAIINRVGDPATLELVDTGDIPVLAVIGEDTSQAAFDILGKSVFDLPDDAEILRGTSEMLKRLALL